MPSSSSFRPISDSSTDTDSEEAPLSDRACAFLEYKVAHLIFVIRFTEDILKSLEAELETLRAANPSFRPLGRHTEIHKYLIYQGARARKDIHNTMCEFYWEVGGSLQPLLSQTSSEGRLKIEKRVTQFRNEITANFVYIFQAKEEAAQYEAQSTKTASSEGTASTTGNRSDSGESSGSATTLKSDTYEV